MQIFLYDCHYTAKSWRPVSGPLLSNLPCTLELKPLKRTASPQYWTSVTQWVTEWISVKGNDNLRNLVTGSFIYWDIPIKVNLIVCYCEYWVLNLIPRKRELQVLFAPVMHAFPASSGFRHGFFRDGYVIAFTQ